MTHTDKGKYFEKHPQATKVDDGLKKEINKKVKDSNIACKAAEQIAQKSSKSMGEVGVAIDMLNINIIRCQLGLFGYDGKKKVAAAADVAPDYAAAITAALVEGRLPCAAAWKIADEFQIKRMDVCAACEKMQIKIKPCQLGAF